MNRHERRKARVFHDGKGKHNPRAKTARRARKAEAMKQFLELGIKRRLQWFVPPRQLRSRLDGWVAP